MTYYKYLLILLALLFCGYACYTDIKTQKIRNICSFGLLYAGTLSQLMAWFLNTTTPLYIVGLFFGSGLVGFAFYWFGVFSPGDSKLFWGLCMIFPLSLFKLLSGFVSFPPLILALNIIIPFTIGVIVFLISKLLLIPNKLEILRKSLMANFQKENLLKQSFSLLLLIGIGSTINYISGVFEWNINRPLQMGIVMAAFILIRKVLSRIPKSPTYYTVIGFACIWISLQTSTSIFGFIHGLALFLCLYFFIFVIVKQLVLGLVMTLERNVDIEDLKIGMIPAEQIVQTKNQAGEVRYEKQQAAFSSGLTGNIVISPGAIGLSKEDIETLRHLADANAFVKFGNKIKIQPDICFAPVITIGTLLTILCQGPFYLTLIQIF